MTQNNMLERPWECTTALSGMMVLAGCEHPKKMTKEELDAMFEEVNGMVDDDFTTL